LLQVASGGSRWLHVVLDLQQHVAICGNMQQHVAIVQITQIDLIYFFKEADICQTKKRQDHEDQAKNLWPLPRKKNQDQAGPRR